MINIHDVNQPVVLLCIREPTVSRPTGCSQQCRRIISIVRLFEQRCRTAWLRPREREYMGFVCSRTFVANLIFSLILRRPISWRPQDTGRQLNHRRRHRHSGTFRSGESSRNSLCIVLLDSVTSLLHVYTCIQDQSVKSAGTDAAVSIVCVVPTALQYCGGLCSRTHD